MMTKKSLFIWETIGLFFIFFAGSLLHFVFDWTGSWRPIAWLAAVNESTWEHLKLAFWPGLIFAIVEYLFIGRQVKNFCLGKFLGLLAMPAAIILLFYGYKAVLGTHNLALDILIFFLAVALGQWLGYKVLTARPKGAAANRLGVIGLLALTIAFALCTYYPPHCFLFEDPNTGGYGIENKHSGLSIMPAIVPRRPA